MNIKRALLILGATLIASAPVQAALTITTYTDKATWKAAVSGEQTETFDAEATGDFANRVFNGFTVDSDATLQTGIQAPGDPTWVWDGVQPVVNGTNFLAYATCGTAPRMLITLDEPTQALGFDWNNTDPTGDVAQLQLVVDGQSFNFGPPGSGFFGITVSNGGFASVAIRDTTGGGGCLEGLGIDDFSFVSADVALFNVTKTFVPASAAPVDVTLTCDSGLPLEQTATILGGDPEGVTFVLTNTQASPDCVVTESVPAGYVGSPTNCTFNAVSNLNYSCAFTNTAADVQFGFTKVWDTSGTGGDTTIRSSDLDIRCNRPIESASPSGYSSSFMNGYYYRSWTSDSLDSDTFYSVTVNAEGSTPSCEALEDAKDSAIEVTTTGACGPVSIPIGSSRTSCVITNTVFFEGIPTLSQYGMAIMALLMLGMGFVGFRRFV